ncbi:response regulator [Synechococcus sp. PCC 7336]|uniref:response regulator n=1 Tax=Synechococcus sp. PCC 7336 TaxID=195250 RepID=UPI0003468BE8|nr:response regulator [Synechococcus sp. PCC 7336]
MIPKRILIVDDEEGILAVVRIGLKMTAGWEVLTATSGAEGLEMAKTEQPDAILLDVMMPDMDGIATFRQLQADPQTQKIPVILLTAKVRGGAPNGVSDLEAAGAIVKPFDALELAERITNILGWTP